MSLSAFLTVIDISLYAIVGGPSVGKTSIIHVLKERGEIVCEEAATDIILAEREKGNLTPWLNEGFELKIFTEKLLREQKALQKAQIIQKKIGCQIQFDISKIESNGFWLDISKLQSKILYKPISINVGLNIILPHLKEQ